MRHILILLIAILATVAFSQQAIAQCATEQAAYDSAKTALAAAEEEKRLADDNLNLLLATSFLDGIDEDMDDFGYSADKGLSGGSNPADRLRRQHAQTQARLRQSRAQRALDSAQSAFDAAESALAVCKAHNMKVDPLVLCPRCNRVDESHLADPQPSCSHSGNVYTCIDSSRHRQEICVGCNTRYWLCGSSAANHRRIYCYSGRRIVGYIGGFGSQAYIVGCRQWYYLCQSSAHRYVIINGWIRGKACMMSGSSGGSTPPATTPSGGGGGGGDSGSRVRCANMPAGATRRTRTHCDKGGYASSAYAHRTECTFPTHSRPITYWSCDAVARRYHTTSPSHSQRILTCRRCGTTFVQSKNGSCTHRGRRYSSHSGS